MATKLSITDFVLRENRGKISDLNVDVWQHELQSDPDRYYLLTGVKEGFMITDISENVPSVEVQNQASATLPHNIDKVSSQILSEIQEGRYVTVKEKPTIVSPLAAIAKDDGTVRLIHDASKPVNLALNDCVLYHDKVKYQSIQDAVNLLKPGSYCCKIDLKSAYRSVGIHPSQYHLCGLKWDLNGKETYLVDTRLMMGASKAPSIFHRLSQAIKRRMEHRGYNVVAYLDDFLIVSDTFQECLAGQHVLIKLLRNMGFAISWQKVCGPSNKIVFLGVEINTCEMTLSLPEGKVKEIKGILHNFLKRKRASAKQIQSLAGKLNWACHVIRCGRSYLRNILDALAHLRMPYHKVLISEKFVTDIKWWILALEGFPGKYMLFKPSVHVIQIDASKNGSGFVFNQDWGYVNWKVDFPQVAKCHINCKETISAVLAARRWAPLWENSKVVFCTDNQTAKACIQKGTSKNPSLLPWVRELHLWSLLFNFDIVSSWIPGVNNVIPDTISRLHDHTYQRYFLSMLNIPTMSDNNKVLYCSLLHHMSYKGFLSCFPRFHQPVGKIVRSDC